jgi:hypothetical protein
MRSFALVCTVLAGGAATLMLAAPAQAQATRTWVSGVGDDVNPCSRTAPCKTFAGAISKTAAGGEINCLDPGGFGAVTIIKSMTIACQYTEGGALAGGNGVTVNMPAATDVTVLRGLDFFGVNPPSNGVRFINQGTLHIIESKISRFNAAGSFGVSYQPSGASEFYITDTYISENGAAGNGGGILLRPTGAGGNANVVLNNVTVVNNANVGVFVDTTGNTGLGLNVTMTDSIVSGNGGNGLGIQSPAGASPIQVLVDKSVFTGNTASGVSVFGAAASGVGSAIVRIGGSTITTNVNGASASNQGVLRSYKDNYIDGNGGNNGPITQVNLN